MNDFKNVQLDKDRVDKELIQRIIQNMKESFLFNYSDPRIKKTVSQLPKIQKLKLKVKIQKKHCIFGIMSESFEESIFDVDEIKSNQNSDKIEQEITDSDFMQTNPNEIKELLEAIESKKPAISKIHEQSFAKMQTKSRITIATRKAELEKLEYSKYNSLLFTEDYITHTKPVLIRRKIEYKNIESKYFNDNNYIADDIHFDFSGKYIKNDFLQILNWKRCDTTVLNIGTGDGKSTVAHELIRKYAEAGFVVIIASPYIVLTNRDYNQLKENLSKEIKIVNYADLRKKNLDTFIKANIHSITINSLLGNPGEVAERLSQEQSRLKKKYLNRLQDYCEKNNKKVVLFFDEIHAGITNFKNRYIENLYLWKKLVHKAFVFSATYTEASNIVLEYIADLTEKKLAIYNSERRKFKQQANLHINLTKRQYTSKDISPLNYLIKIVDDAIKRKDKVNILVSTQSLVTALTDPNSEEPLAKYLCSLNPNILIGRKDRVKNQEKFDIERVNIGTTFSTGISIPDPNNTFIIITPVFIGPDSQKMASIFIEGAPAIIQAFARVRNGGNIHVFMNMPTHLIKGQYMQNVPDFLKTLKKAKYVDSNKQSEIVKEFHKAYNKHIAILAEKGNIDMKNLFFRNEKEYILNQSQYELASNYEIFGKKINPYIIWAAFNNQFTNCTLASINLIDEPKQKVEIQEDTITSDLQQLLSKDFKNTIKGLSDIKAFDLLIKEIKNANHSENELIPVKNEILYKGKIINPDQIRFYPKFVRTLINILYQYKYNIDIDYNKKCYILGNIILAKKTKIKKDSSKVNNLKAAYFILGCIQEELKAKIKLNQPILFNNMSDQLEKNFCIALHELRRSDFYIKYKIFSFMQNYLFSINGDGSINFWLKDKDKRQKILLNELLRLFFKVENRSIRTDGEVQSKKIIKQFEVINNNAINLIFE